MSVASKLSDTAAVESAGSGDYHTRRRDLLARPGPPGRARRRELSALTDSWLVEVFDAASATTGHVNGGVALVAVGGYGRGELSPGSDLDLVLLHAGKADVAALADKVWYPVWDSGVRLDHAVRTFDEGRKLAGLDLAVLLGLLDARLVAGDPGVVGRLRSRVLADWRAAARRRLPALREAWEERGTRHGDLRHDLEPD
ncbi:MAG: [protein-PII] uridylyltransferase, partial [Actinomycetota bacterium]|nr:[protein-PII] uridylyltransferase [Actinomycetota bacterium]